MLQQEQGQRGGNKRQGAELGEALWAAGILSWDPHYHNRAMEAHGQNPFLPLPSFWGLLVILGVPLLWPHLQSLLPV